MRVPPEIDYNEFLADGYLLEVNRRYFHPRGLAMFVHIDDDGNATGVGVYDGRDDPEGWVFGPGDAAERQRKIDAQNRIEDARWWGRMGPLGYWTQPIDSVIAGGDDG